MKRLHGFLLATLVLVAAGVLAARWLRSGPDPVPAAPAATPAENAAPQPVASAPPQRTAALTTAGPETDAAQQSRSERTKLIRSDPVLRERARQHELAPAADARWQQAVDEGAYTADDLDPAVRELFSRVDLEPRYAEGGRIDGLVIRDMASDHPLALAGFRPGDLIESIQGTPLADPADLPSLLAHLGPNVTFCATRGGAAVCRELELE